MREQIQTSPQTYHFSDRFAISGSALKIIALICMLTDHVGAVILEPYILANEVSSGFLFTAYVIMRFLVGRAAFPIYCFLLVEGFLHTSNASKYAGRLFAFAIISEIPFDLASGNEILTFGHQNVYFTLFLGLVALSGYKRIEGRYSTENGQGERYGWYLIVMGFTMLIADIGHVDYGSVGILTISALYFFRGKRKRQFVAGSLAITAGDMILHGSFLELTAPFGLALTQMYNGQRGISMKYVFYLFYPLHLLILYMTRISCMS